jgi:hypothetical protein
VIKLARVFAISVSSTASAETESARLPSRFTSVVSACRAPVGDPLRFLFRPPLFFFAVDRVDAVVTDLRLGGGGGGRGGTLGQRVSFRPTAALWSHPHWRPRWKPSRTPTATLNYASAGLRASRSSWMLTDFEFVYESLPKKWRRAAAFAPPFLIIGYVGGRSCRPTFHDQKAHVYPPCANRLTPHCEDVGASSGMLPRMHEPPRTEPHVRHRAPSCHPCSAPVILQLATS